MSDPVVTLWLVGLVLWFIHNGRLWELVKLLTKVEQKAGIPAGSAAAVVGVPTSTVKLGSASGGSGSTTPGPGPYPSF